MAQQAEQMPEQTAAAASISALADVVPGGADTRAMLLAKEQEVSALREHALKGLERQVGREACVQLAGSLRSAVCVVHLPRVVCSRLFMGSATQQRGPPTSVATGVPRPCYMSNPC
jgi:hypothetical protein